jgi:hypothetical protein
MYAAESADRFVVGGTSLRYESAGGGSWELIAEQILCMGEATSESGPADEDWHICFVTDTHGTWVEGSLHAEGRNDALQWLSVRLGCSLEVKLANAPPFRSRVMWPRELLERPLFEYQVKPWRRLFSRSMRRFGSPSLGGVQSVHPDLLGVRGLRRR